MGVNVLPTHSHLHEGQSQDAEPAKIIYSYPFGHARLNPNVGVSQRTPHGRRGTSYGRTRLGCLLLHLVIAVVQVKHLVGVGQGAELTPCSSLSVI